MCVPLILAAVGAGSAILGAVSASKSRKQQRELADEQVAREKAEAERLAKEAAEARALADTATHEDRKQSYSSLTKVYNAMTQQGGATGAGVFGARSFFSPRA